DKTMKSSPLFTRDNGLDFWRTTMVNIHQPSINGQRETGNRRGQQTTTDHGKDRKAPVPLPLGKHPNLISAIHRDIATVGLVGEAGSGLIGYIAYSSRKLKKPLSVVIKGQSSSGKDEVQRRPSDLMPPEDVKDLMSITPQALYYNQKGWLKHKVLLGGERRHQ